MSNGGIYAWIITLSNRIKPYTIRGIHERMFQIPDLGTFELDEEYRYGFGKSEIYIYNQKSCRPIDIEAFLEITQYRKMAGKQTFSVHDLEPYVLKFRKVEERKRIVNELIKDLEQQQIDRQTILASVFDGSIDYTADKLLGLKLANRELQLTPVNGKLSESTIRWLNSYYSEDIVGRNYLYNRMISEERFRIKPSLPVLGIIPQETMFRSDIAIIVKGRRLEVDAHIKIDYNQEQNRAAIVTKYGRFNIEENNAIFRYKKTRIHFVAVKSRPAEQEVAIKN